ncbi:MAG: Nitrogen regulation protein NR(I) [Syntrophaceae bacterium PtaB.Bin038]|nr:MAG: Nitrogen regulation protein NR(I) [Syntrophaceae bacterium PtaB.Bin038]
MRRGLIGSGFKNPRLEIDPRNAAAAVANGDRFDIALLDINMPWMDGLQLLEHIKNTSPDTECIMVSAANETKIAVDCLRKGAYDYLTKPVNRDEMVAAIRRDEVQSILKTKAVDFRPAGKEDIFKFIHHFYSKRGGEVELRDMIEKGVPDESGPADDEPEVNETDNIVPQIMNKIINEAFRRRASDIRIEPNRQERRVDIRSRIDGELPPYAGMDITEKRLPQDGKIKFRC